MVGLCSKDREEKRQRLAQHCSRRSMKYQTAIDCPLASYPPNDNHHLSTPPLPLSPPAQHGLDIPVIDILHAVLSSNSGCWSASRPIATEVVGPIPSRMPGLLERSTNPGLGRRDTGIAGCITGLETGKCETSSLARLVSRSLSNHAAVHQPPCLSNPRSWPGRRSIWIA
jgi:hypothetical protein